MCFMKATRLRDRKQENAMKATVHKTIASIAHHHRDGAASRAVLALNPAGETILLRGSQHLHIEGAAGWTIRALGGAAWITQDGDTRDVVLEAGQAFTPDRPGEILVSPLGEARLCVARGNGCAAARRSAPASAPAGNGTAFA